FGGPGGDAGDALELGDLIEDIEFSDTANSAGNYTITLHLAEGISFPQEDFYVEYADSDDLEEPADSYLVTPTDGGEIELASEVVFVTVIRPPSSDNPSGNPLTMTIVGTLDLGDDTNALGARVSAWIWQADEGFGTMTFTYKGVVHETTIDGVTNGAARYLHTHPLAAGLGPA